MICLKWNEIEKTLDALEDLALGYLAAEREKRSKTSEYWDIDEQKQRLRILKECRSI